jgi:hypothetical protein
MHTSCWICFSGELWLIHNSNIENSMEQIPQNQRASFLRKSSQVNRFHSKLRTRVQISKTAKIILIFLHESWIFLLLGKSSLELHLADPINSHPPSASLYLFLSSYLVYFMPRPSSLWLYFYHRTSLLGRDLSQVLSWKLMGFNKAPDY